MDYYEFIDRSKNFHWDFKNFKKTVYANYESRCYYSQLFELGKSIKFELNNLDFLQSKGELVEKTSKLFWERLV